MRTHTPQGSTPSPSLEGMEKPIRSFKSFIQITPPARSPSEGNKPLPPTPSLPQPSSPSITATPPAFPGPHRTPSVTSWKAPAEWSADPELPAPQSSLLASPPVSAHRHYSPLLPDPYPDPVDNQLKISAIQSSQQSRLMPILEKSVAEIKAPHTTPPRSPLPVPPDSGASVHTPRKLAPDVMTPDSTGIMQPEPFQRIDSPAHSSQSQLSYLSIREKAFASLGIDYPKDEHGRNDDQQCDLRPVPGTSEYASAGTNRSLVQEEEDVDSGNAEEEEQGDSLSVSRDYHDLLVEQYHDRGKSYAQSRGGSDVGPDVSNVVHGHPADDLDLVPQPLAWSKDPSRSPSEAKVTGQSAGTQNNAAQDTSAQDMEALSATKSKRFSDKINAWVPRRLSVGHRRDAAGARARNHKDSSGQTLRSKQDLEDELRFSKFFSRSNLLRNRKQSISPTAQKASDRDATRSPSCSSARPDTPTPILRLPLGLAVVRTLPLPPPPPAVRPASDIAVDRSRQSRFSADTGSDDDAPSSAGALSSPVSAKRPSHRSSSNDTSSGVDPYRRSGVPSTHSRHSGHMSKPTSAPRQSQTSPDSSRAKGHRFSLPGRPTPSATSPSTEHSVDSGTHAHSLVPGLPLLVKMRDARRQHAQEVRHERLKKSIRVLGPIDPRAVDGHVVREEGASQNNEGGRLPGYMVTGSL
ncbi:hypothetical protein M011DRAFT_464679 [Sporormia fimetaria CBS 119925]|uniref:Uncharacterized protein n=1 Tax=Sporormia fimetaria CBS 119925 TaxID=1340428 RepID=A0A6A6VM45_9PLEO|nr:hypothetical protein M011DRAFT_464679 [Sporormia fimetaria CBS 119925]